jgi:hypothetical protein
MHFTDIISRYLDPQEAEELGLEAMKFLESATKVDALRRAKDDFEFMSIMWGGGALASSAYALVLLDEWTLAAKASYFTHFGMYLTHCGPEEFEGKKSNDLRIAEKQEEAERERGCFRVVNSHRYRWMAGIVEPTLQEENLHKLFDDPETRVEEWWIGDGRMYNMPSIFTRAYIFMSLGLNERAKEVIDMMVRMLRMQPDEPGEHQENRDAKAGMVEAVRFLHLWHRSRLETDPIEKKRLASRAILAHLKAVNSKLTGTEEGTMFHCETLQQSFSLAIEAELDGEWCRKVLRHIRPNLLEDHPIQSVFERAREWGAWAISPEEADFPPVEETKEMRRKAGILAAKNRKKRRR